MHRAIYTMRETKCSRPTLSHGGQHEATELYDQMIQCTYWDAFWRSQEILKDRREVNHTTFEETQASDKCLLWVIQAALEEEHFQTVLDGLGLNERRGGCCFGNTENCIRDFYLACVWKPQTSILSMFRKKNKMYMSIIVVYCKGSCWIPLINIIHL